MPHSRDNLPIDGDSHRMLETLLGNLPGLVYRCRNDEHWTAEFFSDGTLALTGYPADDFTAHRRNYADVIHPDDHGRVWDEVQAALARRERFAMRYRIVTATGDVRWVLEQGCGIFAADGALEALEGFITDITEMRASEIARRENETRLETLFQSMPVAAWEEDFSAVRDHLASLGLLGRDAAAVRTAIADRPETVDECVSLVRILDVNTEAVRLHRARDRADLLAGLDRLVTNESHEAIVLQLIAVAAGLRTLEIDTKVRTFDGEIRDVHLCWSVTSGFEESLRRVIVTTMDMTERQRAQDEAALLQAIARGIGEAENETDAIDFLLRHVCETAGWTLGEAWAPAHDGAGLTWSRGWYEPTAGLGEFQQATRSRTFARGEGLPGSVWAAGQPVWIDDVGSASNFPRRDAAVRAGLKAALGIPVLAHDEVVLVLSFFLAERRTHDRHFVSVISAAAAQIGLLIERKRATDALVRERALAQSTLRSLPGMFYLYDHEGHLVGWNDNFERSTGYAGQELRGRLPYDFIDPEDHALVRERIATVFTGGTSEVEARLLARDGTRTPYYFTGVRVELEGRPHLVGTGLDISPLKLAQEGLARSLREFTALHAIGQRLSATLAVPAMVEAAIDALSDATGADAVFFFRHTATGLVLLGIGPRHSPQAHAATPSLCVGECLCGQTARLRAPYFSSDIAHASDGTVCKCKQAGVRAFASLPLMSEGELLGVLGFASATPRDFSAQTIFLEAIAGTVSLSLRNALLYENAAHHAAELEREASARRQAEVAMRLQASALNATANAIMITDRSGTIEWVNPAWTALTGYTATEAVGKTPRILKSGRQDDAFYRRFWQTVLSGQTVEGDLVNRRKDGSFYHEHETITPLAEADGTITHFIAVKQDITGRLALEEQLRQSQKMDAIGQLAGGVAHDFNNLLTVIQGNTEIARLDDIPPQELREALAEIGSASERATSLTRQLLAFGRRQVMQPRTVDLNESVTSTTRMLQRLIGEDIRMQINLHSRPLLIRADPGMLDQILMNLAVNARDAMAEGGTLTLSTALITPGEDDLRQHPELHASPHACLRVSDTGCGIPIENIAHIFEPFFTTKEPGKGTGLGLATVFGIVKQHGGALRVDSAVGRGTAFEVLLPFDELPTDAGAETAAIPPPGSTGATILVVEDEAAVRRLAVRILETQGYRVLEAPDGPAALQFTNDDDTKIDLLLTDMIMPGGLTGQDLAERLRAKLPNLRTVFMSGYTGDRLRKDQRLQEGFNFLQKPFATAALARCIRARLDLEP